MEFGSDLRSALSKGDRAQPWDRFLPWLVVGWFGVALAVFALLCANRGYGNADELLLLHSGLSWEALGASFWSDLWHAGDLFYRPLGMGCFRLQMLLDSIGAPAVHVASIVHHIGNALLFAYVLRCLGMRALPAVWFVALPTVVPGVAWVAAVYDRLLVTWLLLATLLLVRRGPWAACGACLSFALALLTKETAIAFAPVAVLLSVRTGRQRLATAAISVAAVAFAIWRLPHAPQNGPYQMMVDASALLRLLRYAAFPFSLAAEGPETVWSQRWLWGALGAAWLAVLALRANDRSKTIGLLLLTAAPLGPVVFQNQVSGHYLYTASIGFALLLAHLTSHRLALACAMLALLGAHSVRVAEHWRRTGQLLGELVAAHNQLRTEGCTQAQLAGWQGSEGWILRIFTIYVELAGLQPVLVPDGAEKRAAGLPVLDLRMDGTVVVERP